MAETPVPVDPQTLLDHQNDAQMRVAAATRVLQKSFLLTLIAGQQEYALPSDVIRVIGVSVVATADEPTVALVRPMSTDLAMRITSLAPDAPLETGDTQFYLLGENIGILPIPSTAGSLLVYYIARPAALTDLDTYEVTGDHARLVDQRANCNVFEDDGQPEWAANEEAFYMAESSRLLRKGRVEQATRIRVLGWDTAL